MKAARPKLPLTLTAAQLRKLIKSAGLTQVSAAHAIGIAPRTMRRYVSEDPTVFRAPPTPVVLALRAIAANRESA